MEPTEGRTKLLFVHFDGIFNRLGLHQYSKGRQSVYSMPEAYATTSNTPYTSNGV